MRYIRAARLAKWPEDWAGGLRSVFLAWLHHELNYWQNVPLSGAAKAPRAKLTTAKILVDRMVEVLDR